MATLAKLGHFRFGGASAPNVLELYLDFVCPYSKKQFETFYASFVAAEADTPTKLFKDRLTVIFRPQVQSWHPASTLLHESAIAVALLASSETETWRYLADLFAASHQFYDSHTVQESRADTYLRLSKIVKASTRVDVKQFLDILNIEPASSPSEPGKNGGNGATDLLKKSVKLGRQTGIHVSPTVLFNGLVEGSISSSFTKQDWQTWFDQNLS